MKLKIFGIASVIIALAACSGLKNQSHSSAFGGGFPNKTNPQTRVQNEYAKNNSETVQTDISKVLDQRLEGVHHIQHGPSIPHLPKKPNFEKPFIHYIDSPGVTSEIAPVEPMAKLGFWLSIGGLIGSFIPFVNYLAGLALIGGLVVGIIGLVNINKSNGKFRGKGKAIFAILIPVILFVLALVLFILLFSVFFGF